MAKLDNKMGKKFGRLTVIERAENDKNGSAKWRCRCDCGNEIVVLASSLQNGNTKSCGCMRRELRIKENTTHGGKKTKLYAVWCTMKERCNNPKAQHFEHYGGRGIKVCTEWSKDFSVFRDWAAEHGYIDGMQIDRIDNNGDYFPGNCRFVPQKNNANNKRNNHFLEFGGKRMTLAQWAAETGIPYSALRGRIRRGWSPEKALTEQVRRG